MKVLILSCNTGQGHNTAGKAILEELKHRGIPCEMRDALLFAGRRVSRVVSGTYVGITTSSPIVFKWLYRAGDFISTSRHKSVIYLANMPYADNLGRYIAENGFDTVVTPHLFPAEALTHLRRSRKLDVRFYAVATDYTCIPFWEDTEPDCFFVPHPVVAEDFVAHGIPSQRLVCTGIPVSRVFSERTPQRNARAKLGLPQDADVYLVMTGSMGFGNVQELVRELTARCGTDSCIVVFGGNNSRLKQALREEFSPDTRVRVLDFTDKVALYMHACSLLFTKPGGLTSTEAAVAGIPLVHTAPIPGCETVNAQFFALHGMSLCADSAAELARLACALVHDPAACEAMSAAQRRHINARAREDICDYMAAHAAR